MEGIAEKLKRKKVGYRNGCYEDGNADGLIWAKAASHDELQYVVEHYETTNELIKKNGIRADYYPTKDSILGVYFTKKMELADGMGWKTSTKNHCVPNGVFRSWEDGWKNAVVVFCSAAENHAS